MSQNLVIVESPSKSKTIEKYLGSDYKVVSSKGHIRDLSTKGKYGLGIDVENDFKPDYVTIKGKKSVITELKKDVKDSKFVYLATDPDREGEAISWHLYDCLGLNDNNYKRVVFNEITKNAIIEAFKHSRKIDQNLVNSQETRRMLDRIIGFRLSKLMQAKTSGSSAGRVQSVALKLIVDREREILAFKPEEYYKISADFEDFKAELFKYNNKDIELKNETEANKVLNETLNIVSNANNMNEIIVNINISKCSLFSIRLFNIFVGVIFNISSGTFVKIKCNIIDIIPDNITAITKAIIKLIIFVFSLLFFIYLLFLSLMQKREKALVPFPKYLYIFLHTKIITHTI